MFPEDSNSRQSSNHQKTWLVRNDPALLLSHTAELDSEASASPAQWCTFEHIVILGDSYNWTSSKEISTRIAPIVHNFAQAGDTAEDDLTLQLEHLFARIPSAESLDGDSSKVLFVIWLGINDCGCTAADELEPIVEQIFDAMHDLYVKRKARSFLLIDVPPMHRSPVGKEIGLNDERYTTWNAELLKQAKSFAEDASMASVYVVSSYTIISEILDDPEAHGLIDSVEDIDSEDSDNNEDEDVDEGGDGQMKPMWEDDIHLSNAGHKKLADRLWEIFR
ncbi:hypothetical protein BD779DRAFT_1554800 [Infundibulicybe gibba]|nr:hypothetical protein BD779DRAFT_1554800 [Infundibulicybe gibba]